MESKCLKMLYTHGSVKPGRIAQKLGLPNSTTTDLINRLHRKKLVTYRKYREVSLTREGRRKAAQLLRHHRLLEILLVRELGVSAKFACSESEKLEALVSKEVGNRICRKYDHPDFCPCGDELVKVSSCCG